MPANKIEFNNEVLIDLTQDTATEEDVAVGKTFHKADGSVATGVARVGTVVEKDVNFYDYDGTLLYSYTVDEARNMDELPPLPTQPGLICQEWNNTLDQVKDVNVGMDIGATYITDDGKTRLYIEALSDDFTVILNITATAAKAATIDWGDGVVEENAYAGTAEYWHTYEKSGNYVITLKVAENATVGLGGGSSNKPVLSNYNYTANTYNCYLKKAEIGVRTSLNSYAFSYCYNLETLILSDSSSLISSSVLQYTPSLTCVVFPRNCTSIGQKSLEYCGAYKLIFTPNIDGGIWYARYTSRLKRVVLYKMTALRTGVLQGSGVTEVIGEKCGELGEDLCDGAKYLKRVILSDDANATTVISEDDFVGCYSLTEINIPSTVTRIAKAFTNCKNLQQLIIPRGLTEISANAFYGCSSLKFIDFSQCQQIPTLADVSAFSGTDSALKIRVPAALYDEWIAETNWATYADKIVAV